MSQHTRQKYLDEHELTKKKKTQTRAQQRDKNQKIMEDKNKNTMEEDKNGKTMEEYKNQKVNTMTVTNTISLADRPAEYIYYIHLV
jgi:hypothetical protein